MNNFEAKYLKISSKYLDEKLQQLNVKGRALAPLKDKKESGLTKFVNGFFKS